ncbi:MAG: thioredoxin family protein [Methanomassiliicoccales archaeon]|nr:thioredoxin family protein [Methanomassiliicoccales archaeon]
MMSPKDEARWPEHPLDLSEDELDIFVKRYDLAVVECWVPWSEHCKRMHGIVENLSKDMQGKVAFGKVDARLHHHVPVRFGVKATPTFLLFNHGRLVGRVLGEMSKEELAETIDRNIQG